MTLTEEVAEHTTHCVDYISQAIMCDADTSLEGKAPESAGWGVKHQCKDWDALVEGANETWLLSRGQTYPILRFY
jgi:hypothetical protein